jgi:DNA replication protein DnaC
MIASASSLIFIATDRNTFGRDQYQLRTGSAGLVIDDVGLGQLKRRDDEPTAAHMLFTLLDRRHTVTTTALTSNIKLSAWGKYLGDATLAAAVLDRLAATSIRIDIDGPSYRQHLARQRAGAQPGVEPMLPEEEA